LISAFDLVNGVFDKAALMVDGVIVGLRVGIESSSIVELGGMLLMIGVCDGSILSRGVDVSDLALGSGEIVDASIYIVGLADTGVIEGASVLVEQSAHCNKTAQS
jgi:hypothetical protein